MSASPISARPLRILLVGPGMNYKYGGRYFYSFVRRIANGFTRNGHMVLQFSDRDTADYALGIRAIGSLLANHRLIEIARDLQPDLLCLQHAHLIRPETVARIRREVPGCRVAVVYCDTPFAAHTAKRFRAALQGVDIGFCTTGGDMLRRFADVCPVAFVPNPVDASIDNVEAFSVAKAGKTSDVFYACGKSGASDRWQLVDETARRLPHLRFSLHGRDKRGGIWGDAYYRALAGSRIGLNFNHVEADLYASDRMAQYLGNGLLLATDRRSGYRQYFADDEMIHFDGAADLSQRLAQALGDDARWRSMARKGRSKARAIMSETLVADFIARMALGLGPPTGWSFGEHIFSRTAPAAD